MLSGSTNQIFKVGKIEGKTVDAATVSACDISSRVFVEPDQHIICLRTSTHAYNG